MTTITFDTMEIADRLQKAGATAEYAKAEATILRDIVSSTLDAKLATHDDVVQLDRRIDKIESLLDLQLWMLGFVIALQVAILTKQLF